jgi:hypothetical protein
MCSSRKRGQLTLRLDERHSDVVDRFRHPIPAHPNFPSSSFRDDIAHAALSYMKTAHHFTTFLTAISPVVKGLSGCHRPLQTGRKFFDQSGTGAVQGPPDLI